MNYKSFIRWLFLNEPNFCITCEYYGNKMDRCHHPKLKETDYITGHVHSVPVHSARNRKQDFCKHWEEKKHGQ